MKRDLRLYVDDILDAIRKIEKYVEGLSYDDFAGDPKTADAVVRNFEIIGEAAKRIPSATKDKYPKVPWKMMAGTRDKFIHDYSGVNLAVLWKAVKEDVPALKPLIEELLQEMDKRFGNM